VADIVEVADDRRVHAHLEQALLDVRNRGRRLVAIDGNAHDLGTRARQRRHLPDCSLDIGGIGIGHGLHDDGGAAADQHPADIDGHRPSSFLRPGFGHLWAPLRSSALRSIGSDRQGVPASCRIFRPSLGLKWARASVPIPKFASLCGTLVCELRNRRTLATY
jgi:hypothetical protein